MIKVIILILFFFLLLNNLFYKEKFQNNPKKILVSYVYYENLKSKENFKYFLENGGIINSENIDYIITINGKKCSLNLPKKKNVKYIFRENKCYDIGTHGINLQKYNLENYNYFILMNDTIKGPYLKNINDNWINKFTEKITDDCKLVGLEKKKFIGSMLLCTDKIGINLILPLLTCKKNHKDAVNNGEKKFSKLFEDNNYKTFGFINNHHFYYDTEKYKYKSIFYKVNNSCRKC